MVSSPITSYSQTEEGKVEAVTDFIFLNFRITADNDFSHEIKRHWLFGKKGMTNLDKVLKSRDITLPAKLHIVKAIVFPVVMYRWKSWTLKKAKHQWIDAFKLWCCRRLLRVPWTARRSNQSILKEINPEYSLQGLLLKLQLQYFGHLTWRADSLEKTLMLGKIEGKRSWQRMRWLDNINDLFEQTLRDCGGERSMAFAIHEVAKSRKWLSDWTMTKNNGCYSKKYMLIYNGLQKTLKKVQCIDFSIFWITCWKEVKFRIKNMDIRILAFSWLNKDFAYSFLEHNVLSLLKYMADMFLCT